MFGEFRCRTVPALRSSVPAVVLQAPSVGDMVTHMKTTIEISDAILERAKAVAAREGITLRALVEDGLRQVLRSRRAGVFKLRDAAVDGNGLTPEFQDASWEKLRDAAYEQR